VDEHKPPPFNLDPHVAIQDPGSLPILLRRGMFRAIRQQAGQRDPTYQFISAFNIIAWSLTTAGRRTGKKAKGSQRGRGRLKKGTTKLTPNMGKKLEEQRKRMRDTDEKLRWIDKWAEQLRTQDPDRATMTYEEYKRRGGRTTA
jgi:uncharacterized short protein YbdD (DUF466 family)